MEVISDPEIITTLQKWDILKEVDISLLRKMVYVHIFSTSYGQSVLFITSDDEVYGIGYNGPWNVLGLRNECTHTTERLEEETKIDGLSGLKLKKIIVKWYYGVGLNTEGKGYVWGRTPDKLKDTSAGVPPFSPPFLEHKKIVDVISGFRHIVFKTEEGEMIFWGLSSTNEYFCRELSYPLSAKTVCFDTGDAHVACSTEDGELYTLGANEVVVGHPVIGSEMLPSKVALPEPCKKVYCGSHSTICLATTGAVYAFGKSSAYLCVDGWKDIDVLEPTKILFDEPIEEIAVASKFGKNDNIYAAVSRSGNYYRWGDQTVFRKPVRIENVSSLLTLFVNYDLPVSLSSISTFQRRYHQTSTSSSSRHAMKSLDNKNCLKTLYNNPYLSDVTITVCDRVIFAHKLILSLKSQYFHKLLQISHLKNIDEQLANPKAYRTYIKYFYTLELEDEVDTKHLFDLYLITQTRSENELQSFICDHLISMINFTTIYSIYQEAVSFQNDEIIGACRTFMLNHIHDVAEHIINTNVDSLISLYKPK